MKWFITFIVFDILCALTLAVLGMIVDLIKYLPSLT